MYDFFKSRWVLLVVLVLFIMLKIPHMLYAFYWDESWPYVPAIKEMYRHGISLLPGAVNPDLSRGHPMFFHSIGAAWIHVFGESNKSLHFFALVISLLFLITVYESVYRIFNKRAAVISLLLVATHVSFFVQSSFVLPEILVAFLSFLSIVLYVRERYFWSTLTLVALFLTKESGVVAGFVLGVHGFISLFNRNMEIKKRLLRLLPTTFSCILSGVFLVIQKHSFGWYLFPMHTKSILNNWDNIWCSFRTCSLNFTFCQGYEVVIFIALVVFALLVFMKKRQPRSLLFLIVLVPVILAYYFIDYKRSEVFNSPAVSVIAFIVFMACCAGVIFTYGSSAYYKYRQQTTFIQLLGCFVLCYILFSSIVFFTPRYMISGSTVALILLAVFFDMLISNSFKVLYYPLLVVLGVAAYYSFIDSTKCNDTSMAFLYGVKTQTGLVEYMERSSFYDKHIATVSFLDREHLQNPDCGFLTQGRVFNNIGYYITDTTDLVIFNNIEPDERYNAIVRDTSFHLIYKINIRDAWSEVYRMDHPKNIVINPAP